MAPKRRVGLGVVAIAALALAIRYTPLLDPDLKAAPRLDALAARFHTGAGPCLRYPHEAPPEVTHAADALSAAGVGSEDLGGLVGNLYARAQEQERAHHAASEEDEWMAAITEGSSAPTRLAINLKRDRLRDVLRNILSVDVPQRTRVADLPAAAKQAIDAEWARAPQLFLPSGLIPLIAALRQRETAQRLDAIARALAEHAKAGTVPDTLDGLGLAPSTLIDGWGREIEYERRDGRLVITSIGEDAAAPVTREIPFAAGAPVPLAACPPAGEVTLARKVFDDAIDNVGGLAGSARVVPAMKNGVPAGFKLYAIQPASLLAQAGLCNGDVVKTINGFALSSPEKALELYSAVRAASLLELAIERGGADAVLKVRLR